MRIDSFSPIGFAQDYPTGQLTTVDIGELSLSQVADRLGTSVAELRRANPQLTSDYVHAGQILNIPAEYFMGNAPVPIAGTGEALESRPTSESGAGDPAKSLVMWQLGSPGASHADAVSSGHASSDAVDPRFGALNEALQAGDGNAAIEAAKQLITVLTRQKPPDRHLLNQARMGMAAAAILAGDLDTAQKSMLAIDRKALGDSDLEQYDGLREILKDAHREAYSAAFDTELQKPDGTRDKGKAAADEAAGLLELLRKTDPGNRAEISEVQLKQANALLMGNHYRLAEKALKGIDEKSLAADQKEYLSAIRDGIHAQQIDALSKAFEADMKGKRFKNAAANATAIVNDLAAWFPDSKDQLVVARLQQTTAQIMNGDMEAARKSLGRVDRDHLSQMPDAVQKQYGRLGGAIREHFEAVKKLEALKAEAAAIQSSLNTVDTLTSSGNKADAAKAVPMAEELLTTIQQKYPDNEAAIGGARVTLANAKLAAGDTAGGKADLQSIVDTTGDAATRDRAKLLQARVALTEQQTDKAVQMLRTLSQSAATPELRSAAKGVIILLETSQLKNVQLKVDLEQKRLGQILEAKTPQSGWALLNPFTSVKMIAGHYDRLLDQHQANLNDLSVIRGGAGMAAAAMNRHGLTLGELQKMSLDEIAKLPGIGIQSAREIVRALHNSDVQLIAKDDFQGKFTWKTNTWYVDASYLDTEIDKVGKWIGKQVRDARSYDEELKASDSLFERVVGYTSAGILDAVSASNEFVKGRIRDASEFYNDPSRKDMWYAALGRAGTFGADILSAPFTMPATIADYKATDDERSGAITGTLIMAGTLGLIKSGGPAWRSLGNGISRGASGIAASRLGQWVATSEMGQFAGRTAQKLADKAAALETRFEATSFAKGMDKLKAGLGKLNPEISFGKAKIPAPIPPQDGWTRIDPTTLSSGERQLVDDVVNAPQVLVGRGINIEGQGYFTLDNWIVLKNNGVWDQRLQDVYNYALYLRTSGGTPVYVLAGRDYTAGEAAAAEAGAAKGGITNFPFWPD